MVSAAEDEFTAEIDRLGRALVELRSTEEELVPWPAYVPHVTPDLSQLRGVEDRAACDLMRFAQSFLLLHESCHAVKRAAGEGYGQLEEEIACDRFGIDYLLGRCDAYVPEDGYDRTDVLRKRAMGLFVGLVVIIESTERGLWAPSESHPPVRKRIELLTERVEPCLKDADDPFWVLATCALLSKLRREKRLPEAIPYTDCRDLFSKVVALLA
jgi:hypothetical protein